MATMKTVQSREIFMGKLTHGNDLLEELTTFCKAKNIQLGRIQALGAVQKASLGFYNQQTREYHFSELEHPLEIINLTGNISLRDGSPAIHAHITLADENGNAFGGHLGPGTIIFACECIVEAFDGPVFERTFDAETSLPLWADAGGCQ